MEQKTLLLEILAKNDAISTEAIQIMIDKLIELDALEDVLERINNIQKIETDETVENTPVFEVIEPFDFESVKNVLISLDIECIEDIYEHSLFMYKAQFVNEKIPIAVNYNLDQKIELSIKLAHNLLSYQLK